MKTIRTFEAFKGKKPKKEKIELDLSGPDGNAFSVMGLAKNLANQLGYTEEEKQQLMDDMKSSDYDNLIQIFNDKFGDFVDIYGYKE